MVTAPVADCEHLTPFGQSVTDSLSDSRQRTRGMWAHERVRHERKGDAPLTLHGHLAGHQSQRSRSNSGRNKKRIWHAGALAAGDAAATY